MGNIEPKILARSKVILKSKGIKFGGGGKNALAGLEVTFININASINNCCFWLSIRLIFALIDSLNY